MTEHRYPTAAFALPHLAEHVLEHGEEVGSRGGERVQETLHQKITLTNPVDRYITTHRRRASLPAQIAETVWVLSGRDDIGWLSHYLPRAPEFSDDGKTWRGAYGPRIRAWGKQHGSSNHVDQLAHVVELLRRDPTTRRAVIQIYDPAVDTLPGKDIPCNNWLHFTSRLGELDLNVATRSNDLIWGWSGINAFQWSALQEIVAEMLGIGVGRLTFNISSLHIYDRHWKRAKEIAASTPGQFRYPETPAQFRIGADRSIRSLDNLLSDWFILEEAFRSGLHSDGLAVEVAAFPEPMLREWLLVIGWYWTREDRYLGALGDTALRHALELSPKMKNVAPVEAPVEKPADRFVEFVAALHEDKHKVYGDSWKRRGETLGIMANLARKVDRLGEGGGGDTSADTAIDLLVYLVKYRMWLVDMKRADVPASVTPDSRQTLSDQAEPVREFLQEMSSRGLHLKFGMAPAIDFLKHTFEDLHIVAERKGEVTGLLTSMINAAYPLAEKLWEQEEWKKSNDTRTWKGYEV